MTDPKLVEAVKSLSKDHFTTGPNWNKCHDLCQSFEGTPDYDWVHGFVHLIEGDTYNSNYWYKRSGQQRMHDELKAEWQHIVEQLGRSTS